MENFIGGKFFRGYMFKISVVESFVGCYMMCEEEVIC